MCIHFTFVYNTNFTSIDETTLTFSEDITGDIPELAHAFQTEHYKAHLDHLHEASQYITICTTCLPLLMVLVCKKHQQSWHFEASTFNLTHTRFSSKVSQCLVFCQGWQSKYAFVFNQFSNLGTGGPKWNFQSRLCTWFSTWVMDKTQSRRERQ